MNRAKASKIQRSVIAAVLSVLMVAAQSGAQAPDATAFTQRAEALQSALATWQESLKTMAFGEAPLSRPSLGNRRDQCLEWISTILIVIARVKKNPAPGQQFSLLSSLTYFDNTLLNLRDALQLARTVELAAGELARLEDDQEAVTAMQSELHGFYAALESGVFVELRRVEAASQPPEASALQQPGEISGHVYRLDSGKPLADAVVTMESPSSPESDKLQRTGEDGSYEFSGLAPGNYWEVAYRSGFVGSVFGVKSQNASEGLIPLAAGEKRVNVDFRLPATPEIATLTGEALEKVLPSGAVIIHLVAGNPHFTVTAWYGQLDAMAALDGADPFTIATGGDELYTFVFDPNRALVYYPVPGRYYGAIVCFDLETRLYQTTALPFSEGLKLLHVKREGDTTLAAYTVDGPCVPKALANGEDPWILPARGLPVGQPSSACLATITTGRWKQ